MTALPGRWALTMRTPVGRIEAEMTFTDRDGTITGTAEGKAETVPLIDVRSTTTADGEHVTWNEAITRPMRLDLAFDVTVVGGGGCGCGSRASQPRT